MQSKTVHNPGAGEIWPSGTYKLQENVWHEYCLEVDLAFYFGLQLTLNWCVLILVWQSRCRSQSSFWLWSLPAFPLTTWPLPWLWMSVSRSSTNLRQKRKGKKIRCINHFEPETAYHPLSPLILDTPNLGLNLCWSGQFFSSMMLLPPILKVQNYFGMHWFCLLAFFFLWFWGHKILKSCKIMYFINFISFNFHFPPDLNNTLDYESSFVSFSSSSRHKVTK